MPSSFWTRRNFFQRIESATFIAPPFAGSPWADILARFTPGLHQELTSRNASQAIMNFKNRAQAHLTTITANPRLAPVSPLLKTQHTLLTKYLQFRKMPDENDGLVPLHSQKAGLFLSHHHISFPGDHHQVIGAGPWPQKLKSAHELYLDHCIFLAERDLQATK
jgi:hypothetical protein